MINVSDAFLEKLNSGDPLFEVIEATFQDGSITTFSTEIMGSGSTITDSAESSAFPVGVAVCKSTTVTLDNSEEQFKDVDFFGAKLHVKLTFEDFPEFIDKGIYTVTTPETYGEVVNITAYDDMYKSDKEYATSLTFPQSLFSLIKDACEQLGIPMGFSSMDHGDIVISSVPDGVTYRKFFGYAAMVECANARIDRKGYLQLVKWDLKTAEDTDESKRLIDFSSGLTLSASDISITGIRVKNGSTEFLQGKDGYVLELENTILSDSLVQSVAGWIGDKLIGAKFRNMQGDLIYAPLVEFGDMCFTYDRRGRSYLTPITDVAYDRSGMTTVKTQADDPVRSSNQYYTPEVKTIIEARKLVAAERTAREQALGKLEESLKDSTGMYTTYEKQEDGSTITYLHDRPTLEKSQTVIKLTSEAVAVSNDGGETYPYGFILNGTLITRLLYAEGINADYIDAGAITVKDKDGAIIFQVDFSTGSAMISGDCVKIGDKTASVLVNEALEAAQNAKSLSLLLSNEYQGIPVDADGNYTVFPSCFTIATAMFGSGNVTGDCTFSIQKSDSISGSWSDQRKMYSVTGLSADSGWVDITVTYLNSLTITKRFTVTKQYAGASGDPGRTYLIEASSNVLKRSADSSIVPQFITFSAYYRDGSSAVRQAYSGRFVIEETSDGDEWTTIYTSSEDEESVTHYLYSMLTAADGKYISTANGSTIGIPRDTSSVRCKLYASGGTDNLMDIQSVAVLTDIGAFSQEEIVDILSDGGRWKGLYYLDGHLYISFDAAVGGTLKLGGEANGNGKLIVLDAAGKQIGYIDNTGVNFPKGTFSGTVYGGKVVGGEVEGAKIVTSSESDWKSKLVLEKGVSSFYTDYEVANTLSGEVKGQYYENEDGLLAPTLDIYGYSTIRMNIDNGELLRLCKKENADLIYMYAPTTVENSCSIKNDLTVSGTIYGTLNSGEIEVETLDIEETAVYAENSSSQSITDYGLAKTDESGECYVSIEKAIEAAGSETAEYSVFLQPEGDGKLYVCEKDLSFFKVKGTAELPFSWMLRVYKRGTEMSYLDNINLKAVTDDSNQSELEAIASKQLAKYDLEMEEAANENLESCSGN